MTTRVAGTALVLLGAITPAAAGDPAALRAEAKALMQRFGGAVKAELVAAVQAGGPVEAIAACHDRAPMIAAETAGDSGWTVARSSHRLRNSSNAPDADTAAAIEEFLAREAAGEGAAILVRAEIVEAAGGRAFRMVKAISTAQVCLACHGDAEVGAATEAKIADLYPADQTRGFKEGEMRGVFTLRKALE